MRIQSAEWGSGREPGEAKAFTAARLAEGASMLRDMWYTAWLRSEEELWDSPVLLTGATGRSVLDLLRDSRRIEVREGEVVAVGQRRNGREGRRWTYTVNGTPGTTPPGKMTTRDGDAVVWRFAG